MNRPNTFPSTREHKRASYGTSAFFVLMLVGVSVSTTSVLLVASDSSAFFEDRSTRDSQTIVQTENMQTLTLLQAARNLDPNPARGGGDIQIVNGTALSADTNPFKNQTDAREKRAGPDQISLYAVREGDTLSQVATMFNVSVSTIVWANTLSSNKDIHPGQTLLILPVSGVQHTVQGGDTIQALAKRYGGDVEEIIAFNDLPSDGSLTRGVVVTIPGGEVPAETKAAGVKKMATTGSTSNNAGSGYFIHPLPGSIRTQGIHGYNGIDFGAPAGTPIRAAAAGRVIVSRQSGWNGGYGNYVVIDHPNGTQTLYAHMTVTAVTEGQQVVAGQTIGTVGNTGRSTGNHLHVEVRGAKNPWGA